jgi:hypothetical protein
MRHPHLRFTKLAIAATIATNGITGVNAHPAVVPSVSVAPLHQGLKVLSPLVLGKSKLLALHGGANAPTISQLLNIELNRNRFADQNALISSRIVLGYSRPLSGASAALRQELAGLANKATLSTETQLGPIIAGQTYSSVYVSANFNGSTTLVKNPMEVDEFGAGNPLNTNGAAGTVTLTNTNPFFIFGSSPVTLPSPGLPSNIHVPVRPLSLAGKAFEKLYAGAINNGVSQGIYLRDHPVGGVLEGTYYYPNSFYPVSYQLLAFGNSPLNNQSIQSVQYNPFGSYLQFANGVRVSITNGQFLSTYYFPGSAPNTFQAQAYNFDVFGSNPLNVGIKGLTLGANYPFTVPYYLY